jgi:hypothetical protein
MDKKPIKLIVNGEKIKISLKSLTIKDIDKSMKQISSKIAYWGRILAIAEREKDMAEAYYRRWRAVQGKVICGDSKISEWKLNQELNSSDKFIKLKEAIANANYNVNVLARYYEALNKQSFNLPSLGAKQRAELKTLDMNTKE